MMKKPYSFANALARGWPQHSGKWRWVGRDDADGLQVQDAEGKWRQVEPADGFPSLAEITAKRDEMQAAANLSDRCPPITVLQLALGLWKKGEITAMEAQAFAGSDRLPPALTVLINQLPIDQQEEVSIRAAGAESFAIDHPLVKAIAYRKGWSDAQLEEFWAFCREL